MSLNWQAIRQHSTISQLSDENSPNNRLPKTLNSVQLQPNITYLCPAMVACFYSNLDLKIQENKGCYFLKLGFSSRNCTKFRTGHSCIYIVFLSYSQMQSHNIMNIRNFLCMAIIYTPVNFLPILTSSFI